MNNDPHRPLAILYVDTDRVWRGGQEQLFTLVRGMRNRGHQVFLAAPPESPLSRRLSRLGIPTLAYRQRHELSPGAFGRLCQILKHHRFDVVHSNGPRCILPLALASRLRGIPLRVCSRRVNFPLRSVLSRLKYNWSQEAIVTVSKSVRETLLNNGIRPELLHVIYEGVDVDWVDRLERPLLDTPRPLTVGTVAHMSPEKGYPTLLQAAALLCSRFSDATFVLVGSGELEEKLRRLTVRLGLQDHTRFTGFRSDSEALMKGFDVFCLPSLSEGLSSAILAAMANRLPVVATRVGGIPELVMDGKTGLLVPPAQPEALSRALETLLRSPRLRRQMGHAGRARVEEKFTLEKKVTETEQLYRQLLAVPDIG